MPRGRPRGSECFPKVARLRAEGLSFTEIGRRLGFSKQWAHEAFQTGTKAGAPAPIRCRSCKQVIAPARLLPAGRQRPQCLACLGRNPRASFAERLVAHRLAADLTVARLAGKIAVRADRISRYERGLDLPRPPSLRALARALGVPIHTLWPDEGREGGRARKEK